jgi:hypothetical protein
MGKSTCFLWDAVTVDNMQIDPEATAAPIGLQVISLNNLNSNVKAALPSGSHRSQVSLCVFFSGGCGVVDDM